MAIAFSITANHAEGTEVWPFLWLFYWMPALSWSGWCACNVDSFPQRALRHHSNATSTCGLWASNEKNLKIWARFFFKYPSASLKYLAFSTSDCKTSLQQVHQHLPQLQAFLSWIVVTNSNQGHFTGAMPVFQGEKLSHLFVCVFRQSHTSFPAFPGCFRSRMNASWGAKFVSIWYR